MPAGGSSDLHDIFDSTPPNGLTEEFDKGNGTGARPTGTQPFTFNSSTFDSMLEMLPDDMDLSFSLHGSQAVGSLDDAQLNGDGLDGVYEPMPHTQPIDIASNHQGGEIAPLWDFKVEDFMVTPGGSDMMSRPNSFNSNGNFHPESEPTGMAMGKPSYGSHSAMGANINQLLGASAPHNHFESQSTSSSPRIENSTHSNSNSNSNNNNNNNPGGSRSAAGSRRSSSQFSKTVHTEDGGIALSSNNTTNSVRKNPLSKQLSSTSLSNFKRGSSSGPSDLPKKTPLQCFNCKTFKTPLWRRDAQGNTLCNACGLFQKLHGTMRPLSLKSDVIKKRNTKKRAEKQAQQNGNARNNNSNNNASKNNKQSTKKNAKNSTDDSEGAGGFPVLSQSVSVPVTNFDMGLVNSPVWTSFGHKQRQQQQTLSEGLNPNNLMDHNQKLSSLNSSAVKKSRRSSTSSNNSSSSRSSSRSVVPILPKPSPGAPQLSFNLNGSNSAGNSAASSPRVLASCSNADSPMSNWQQGMYPSSAGKPGITIPRRKSSRNHSSSSSSFMAASLQQLQQQHQKQDHPVHQQQFPNIQTTTASSAFSVPNSWNSSSQASVGYSPGSARSPKGAFDVAGSPVDSPGSAARTNSRKSHTSLLSQQLQNSALYHDELASQPQPECNTPTGHQQGGGSNAGTPQPMSLKRTSVTASPRNSYADSLLQQRGIKEESGSSLRRQTSAWARRNVSLKDQVISSNAEAIVGSNAASLAATPTVSTTATPAASGENGDETHGNIADELDWLKFGM